MNQAPRARALTRRSLLGLAGAFTLSACSVNDPRIRGPLSGRSVVEPSPEPPLAGLAEALALEAALAASATTLRDRGAEWKVPAPAIEQARAAAGVHGDHLAVLRGPRPVDRRVSATSPTPLASATTTQPVVVGPDAKAALGQYVGQLTAAQDLYAKLASAASGPAALLWGSLGAYAAGLRFAVQNPAPRLAPTPQPLAPAASQSATEAVTALLTQTHAVVFALQAAYPFFRRPESPIVWDALYRRRALRDELTAWLRARGVQAPAAEAAYGLDPRPIDRNSAALLLARVEMAFTPYAGAWLAAADDAAGRRRAYEVLLDSSQLALTWGGALPTWPGWA